MNKQSYRVSKNTRKLSTLLAILTMTLCLPFSVYAADDIYMGGFDGVRKGTLKWVIPKLHDQSAILSSDWISKHEGMQIRLVIQKNAAKVFLKYPDEWREIMPGKFNSKSHKTNAIVSAFNSSDDIYDKTVKGGWVETWNFTLTHKSKEIIYVYFIKSVNNYLLPFDSKDEKETIIGRFYRGAFGELEKVRNN